MSRYRELTAKVDAFFERVSARHGEDMQCGTGCSDCCHVRLTVTATEARAIRDEIATWTPARRAALAANPTSPDRCVALDPAGRCLIYAARPIVCRSHGAPIRLTRNSLPIARSGFAGPRSAAEGRLGESIIENCFRNFTHTTPDPDCVLDQTTLSALVLAVDGGREDRVDLAELIGSAADE